MIKGVYTSIVTKLAFISLVVLSICNKAYSQDVATKLENPNIIYLRPFGYLNGANIGYEKAINKKISLASEVFYEYQNLAPRNLALTESVKWYFHNWSAFCPYVRFKGIVGVCFDEYALYDSSIINAGLGVGVGYKFAIGKAKRFTLMTDVGLRGVFPVGNIHNPFKREDHGSDPKSDFIANALYYEILSPYAPFELSFGIGYAF